MTIPILGVVLLAIVLIGILAFRRKQTIKLTADEYNLLMRKKFDNYELRSFLVRGDFNTTFEAFDPDRKAVVALRILDHNKIYHDQIVHQFNLKGEMLKFLAERYPGEHFVQGIKFGTVKIEEEPRPYIVSEYVQGASLSDVLDLHDRLTPKDALAIIGQLADAVALAHSQRIWVREVAPQNVLLTMDPAGKLVVTLANVGVPYKSLPSEYAAELKKGYYSPEDRKDQLVDERSDVYALAALMFRMLEGYDPSGREEGQKWSDLSSTLEPSLAEEPLQRPQDIESFRKTLTSLHSAKSSAANIVWAKEIPRLVAKRAKMKVKRTDAEVIEQAPIRRRGGFVPVSKQTKDRMVTAFITGLFTTMLMWMGKKIEGMLASPKKLIMSLTFVLVGMLIALWYFVFSSESGDIIVKVDVIANQAAPEMKKGVAITIEAKDEKTGGLSSIRFSSDFADSAGEGRVVLRTGRRGTAPVSYRGRFERAQTKLTITAAKEGELMSDMQVKSLTADILTVSFNLRPVRSGSIAVKFSDAKKILRPGTPPPENCTLEIYATNAAGAPLKNAQFWYDNALLPNIGPGKAQTQDQRYTLESRHLLRYQVEDSAMITVTPHASQNPLLEFEATPAKWRITQSGATINGVIGIKKRSSTERETFVFQVFDEDGSPVEGLDVYLNERVIGKTDEKGKLEYSVIDVEEFWGQKPVIKVDLHTFNTQWAMSRDYQLQRVANQREIPIRIKDIKPEN